MTPSGSKAMWTVVASCLLLALPTTCFVHVAPSALPHQPNSLRSVSPCSLFSRTRASWASIYADNAKPAATARRGAAALNMGSGYFLRNDDRKQRWSATSHLPATGSSAGPGGTLPPSNVPPPQQYAPTRPQQSYAPASDIQASSDFSSYDWQNQWYAIAFEKNIPGGKKPTAVSIFDESFVLYRDSEGVIQCLRDLCPHRAAKLSEGQVFDGKLECLYHGWQFSSKGECVKIPQLEASAQIPQAACVKAFPVAVREGIVYVFPGSDEAATRVRIPSSAFDLDDPSTNANVIDFQVDLPYDHSYLLENLLDPAHIAISHDATPGGGDRNKAGPYDMQVHSVDVHGFRAQMKNSLSEGHTSVDFEAPGIINYGNVRPASNFTTRIYCLPKGASRARLLFRVIVQTQNRMLKLVLALTPAWKRHLNSNVILEQDVGLITSQEDHFARGDQSKEIKDVFLPIRSSDTFVVAYRKWLDSIGHGLPFYRGWATHKLPPTPDPTQPALVGPRAERPHRRDQESRYWRHVVHCSACKGALRRFQRAQQASTATALLAASAILFFAAFGGGGMPAVGCVVSKVSFVAVVASLALRAYCARVIPRFFNNYQRHPILE